MTFSARETALLAERGFDDLLLAYPSARPDELGLLADVVGGGARVFVTVDDVAHVRGLQVAAKARGLTIECCIDVDASWRPLGGRAHLGVRRSPIRTAESASRVGDAIGAAANLRLTAVLAYEAQVAGMADHHPSARLLDPVKRLIKRRSVPVVAARRAAVVARLRADGHDIQVVNGGGTGSVRTTGADPSVTEVTAGSAFYCPHLFDGYDDLSLEPAAFFAVAVARRSDPGLVTCAFGGYPASGAMGADRQPLVHRPAGLAPLDMEGFGEVQTPLRVPDGLDVALGDPIICRHAKAGELLERFGAVLLVQGGRIVERVPSYRGLGYSVG